MKARQLRRAQNKNAALLFRSTALDVGFAASVSQSAVIGILRHGKRGKIASHERLTRSRKHIKPLKVE